MEPPDFAGRVGRHYAGLVQRLTLVLHDPEEARDVASTSAGYVAAGSSTVGNGSSSSQSDTGVTWTSRDGLVWERQPLRAGARELTAIALAGNAYAVVGSSTAPGPSNLGIWASRIGGGWAAQAAPAAASWGWATALAGAMVGGREVFVMVQVVEPLDSTVYQQEYIIWTGVGP